MKLKLYRLANLFNPSLYRSFIILFAVIILGAVYVGFRMDFIVSGIFVLLIYLFLYPLLNYPRYIEFKGNNIYYISPITLPIKRGRGFFRITAKYHISDITKFTFLQNKVERLFGFGHIVFEGKTNIDAGKHTDRLQPKNTHYIYGILVKKHKHDISSFAKNLALLDQ